jgi:hypothetical protein
MGGRLDGVADSMVDYVNLEILYAGQYIYRCAGAGDRSI